MSLKLNIEIDALSAYDALCQLEGFTAGLLPKPSPKTSAVSLSPTASPAAEVIPDGTTEAASTNAPAEESRSGSIDGEVIPPTRKRRTKAEIAADEAKAAAATQADIEEVIDATKNAEAATGAAETVAEKADTIPDIETVREALKRLGKEVSHDAVFEVLGRYKAKNASTVPEDKRAEVIAEVEARIVDHGRIG